MARLGEIPAIWRGAAGSAVRGAGLLARNGAVAMMRRTAVRPRTAQAAWSGTVAAERLRLQVQQRAHDQAERVESA